jgi:4-amino-4-deoxy-L-arabinose transferase-like glycosyltransferase
VTCYPVTCYLATCYPACYLYTVITIFQKYRLDIPFILCVIIAGSLALFFNIGDIPPTYPWSDESEIAADAVATLESGPRLFYPGQLAGGSLAVWLEAGWMALFGKALVGLRVLNGLVNLISAALLYLLVCQLPLGLHPDFRRALAFTAALLLAVSTWLLGLGRIAAPNWSLVSLMTTLAFYLAWLGLNTNQRRYFLAAGVVTGLLFYSYIPGYFVPLVPAVFLSLIWTINRFYELRNTKYVSSALLPTPYSLLLFFIVTLIVAAPILIFFALNPAATLQRPLQLADTNELAATGSLAQGAVDMASTFGLFPNWLLQGNFEHLAFDPLVTVLFVVGLLIALWHWRNPAYLFLLVWWGVMIIPALLSRSASQGFIFEVWRRGIGVQPVSFIFPALAVVYLGMTIQRITRERIYGSQSFDPAQDKSPNLPVFLLAVVVGFASAGLSYWLYFERWANSGAIPALFAEAPVRMVEWMEAEDSADTLFIFPIRPRVSPTTRPELFTMRYLYDGPATIAFPVMDETTVGQTLSELLQRQPSTVKLMMSSRIEVDPKGYFEYALGSQGQLVGREPLPDYVVTTYQLRPEASLDPSLEPTDVNFGQALKLTGRRFQPGPVTAGQTLGIVLRWLKQAPEEADYNVSLALYDGQDYEWVKVDQPLLSAGNYQTTRHWPPDAESTLYYALPIPVDTPPGQYTVRVVAYNVETGAQLPPIGGLADLSLPLAEINVLPNPVVVDLTALAISQSFDVQFPGGLGLIGAESSAQSINRPGDQIWVTLWWQAAESLSQDIGLVLALALPDGEPAPLFEKPQPLLADYPTTAWPAGHIYRANYRVLLPATLDTNDYALALRLFDLETAEPLAEQLLFPLSVEARPHIFEAPALAHQLDVDFEETIRLLGFELTGLSPQLQPGQEVRLKLQWQALREMRESYKIFLHLTDATGQIVSQVDTLPQQGAAPTSGWVAGEIIQDELALTIPPEMPPDSYRLVIGLYNEKTGERLMAGQHDHVVLVMEGR